MLAKDLWPRWVSTVDDRPTTCGSCGATIYWCITATWKRAPLDIDGNSHFTTCPNAARHRKAKVST